MSSDVTLSVLGVALVTLPYVRWHMRERRHALDAIIHAEFMLWLGALDRAGHEQSRDVNTTVIVARHQRLVSSTTYPRLVRPKG